jgi:hypothetical protein
LLFSTTIRPPPDERIGDADKRSRPGKRVIGLIGPNWRRGTNGIARKNGRSSGWEKRKPSDTKIRKEPWRSGGGKRYDLMLEITAQ